MTTENNPTSEFTLGDVKVDYGADGVPFVRLPEHTGMLLFSVSQQNEPTFGFMIAGPKGFTLDRNDPDADTHITRLALAYGLTHVASAQFQQIYELGLAMMAAKQKAEAEKAQADQNQLLLDLKKPERPAVDLANMEAMGRG